MILYIVAIPVFSFALPLYSFWHMDDFSWGNTRIVTGEKGQKIVISDEGKFDENCIPHKKWEDYQAELWEAQSQRGGGAFDDSRTEVSGYSYGSKSYAPTSEYGGYGRQTLQPGQPMQSRMSVARSEMSMADGMMMGGGGAGVEMFELPTDDAILAEIRDILRTADLMTVTKKSIKHELEARFGLSLNAKRTYINSGLSPPPPDLRFGMKRLMVES